MRLASMFEEDFVNRVALIVLTDSVHGFCEIQESVSEKTFNFVTSDKPRDADLGEDDNGIAIKSAGHTVHEWTPSSTRLYYNLPLPPHPTTTEYHPIFF